MPAARPSSSTDGARRAFALLRRILQRAWIVALAAVLVAAVCTATATPSSPPATAPDIERIPPAPVAAPASPASAQVADDWKKLRVELIALRISVQLHLRRGVPQLLLAAAIAAGLLLAGRFVVQPWLYRWAGRRWPESALRLSLPGFLAVLVQTVLAWISGLAIVVALDAGSSARVSAVGQLLLALLALGSFVMALGRAYLSLVDAAAGKQNASRGLRTVAAWIASLLLVVAVVERMALWVDAGPLVRLWVQWGIVGLFVLCFGAALRQTAMVLRRAPETMELRGRRTFQLLRVACVLGWLALLACVAAALFGRGDFAVSLAKQILWSVLVLLFFRLAWRLLRDATDVALDARTTLRGLARRLGAQPRRIQQVAVVVIGVGQAALALFALVLLAAPYGLGPDDLFGRVLDRNGELHLGSLTFSPAQLLRTFLALAIALLAVRLATGWLAHRLLPTTRLDRGMQSSLASLAGYAGTVIAISIALAALGIGLDRIAWIASALTVGIGFGLQAIVQNFVSGLILLAERPIKVGDWVVVGDAEGDVRRINVRATEIAMADRTTVLVPNSEFITKVVRNRTFAASDGLVKIMLPLAIGADVVRATQLIAEVVQGHSELLAEPPPSVQTEEVKDGRIWIGISAYVHGPRQAARIRAALLYALLQRLQSEGIALG